MSYFRMYQGQALIKSRDVPILLLLILNKIRIKNIMILKQIGQKTLADQAEEEIKKAIIESQLKPGDKLPSELEYAEKLAVSRNVIREAMSRLRMLGVVESRKKRGLVLTEPDPFKGLASIIDLPILTQQSKSELYQLREFFEIGIAGSVFEKKSAEDIAYLETIVTKEEQDPANIDIAIQMDVLFHKRLYEITDNSALMRFQVLLKPYMEINVDSFEPKRFELEGKISHRDLLEALKGDDCDLFIRNMRLHLKR